MSLQLFDDPLAETCDKLQSGELTLSAYLEELRDRVETLEPEINCLVEEPDWDRLAEEAAALDDRSETDELPLYGIPLAVKDMIRMDGFPTRANSDVPPEVLAGPEASAVTRLREAGCLGFAKAETFEFAFAGPGKTHNPHDLEHTTGGSSSGSAAAVAAGLCPLALGTQTGGSHIRPAAFCGIVGFKPTFRRVPRDGVFEVSESLDHVGVYTQDIEGAKHVAAVICDNWGDDIEPPADPTLGVPTGPYLNQIREEGESAFEVHREALETAGYDIRETDVFDDIEETYDHWSTLCRGEGALAHHERFEAHGDGYSNELSDRIAEGREVKVEALARARMYQKSFRESVETTMEEEGIDLWVCPPAFGTAPKGHGGGNNNMNSPWTLAGTPVMSLPGGFVDGLPVGLQVVASTGEDERLLQWAEALAPVVEDAA